MSARQNIIDAKEIMKWLPHRHPFLLIDTASEFEKMTSIVGHKAVTSTEPWVPGHFPGNPIMPGVLLVESMAQTGALLAAKSLDIRPKHRTIMFSAVSSARFKKPVVPGDRLDIPVKLLAHKRNVLRFEAQVLAQGREAANCTFIAMAVEN